MGTEVSSKVQARHLSRNAYLYVRQSTLRQVFENTESTKRQYALRQRAIALGWQVEQVVVIDSDQGRSGASAVDREGFQRLVTEVGLGRAGIVMGLEVSRLARNSTDWHRLLEICALADTLILDEDGVYDPAHFNDRLLLGLKGTMSEAELHVLKARLRGGILNKARRGELEVRLPIGFVHDPQGRVRLDPDLRIQDSVRQLLRTFERTGSASATVKAFREQGLMFPRHALKGPRDGDILWSELTHSRTLFVLHNPSYAGAFTFGRTRQRKRPDGSTITKHLPQSEWTTLIRDAHDGYLSWAQYEQNLQRLRDNAKSYGEERERGAPREGPALLQGLAICAICSARMTVRYHQWGKQTRPTYMCQHMGIETGRPICQSISGASLDQAVGKLLVEMVTPMTLELALQVQKELESRSVEHDTMRRQEVERARYECDLARRRYMQVDPDNRLVADSLEAEWNEGLRAHEQANERYQKQRDADATGITDKQRANTHQLGQGFPAAMERSPHAGPRAQAHGTPSHHRRDRAQGSRHHRADPLQRRHDAHPASGVAQAGMATPPDPFCRCRTGRPTPGRLHRRRGSKSAQYDGNAVRMGARIQPNHRAQNSRAAPSAKSIRAAARTRPADQARDRRASGCPVRHHQEVAACRLATCPPLHRPWGMSVRTPRCNFASQASTPGEEGGAVRSIKGKFQPIRHMRCTMQHTPCPRARRAGRR